MIHQSPSVQQFAQAVKSAEGPDAVVGIPNDQLADYVNEGLTAEVPAELYNDADFSEAAVQACYVDGKYAAPLSVETTALFYNTDMVEKVPATGRNWWNRQWRTAVCSLMPPVSIMIWNLSERKAAIFFNYQNGAYDTSDIGLANDVGQYRRIISLVNLCNRYGLITADVTVDIARSNFQNGKCAYYIGGPWDIDGLLRQRHPLASRRCRHFTVEHS